jgi:hypothetical protein
MASGRQNEPSRCGNKGKKIHRYVESIQRGGNFGRDKSGYLDQFVIVGCGIALQRTFAARRLPSTA